MLWNQLFTTFNKLSKSFDGNARVLPLNYAASNKENTAKLYHGGTDPQNSLNSSPRLRKGTSELVYETDRYTL